MTAVVFGSRGQLGTEFLDQFRSAGRTAVGLDRDEADIADLEQLRGAVRKALGPDPRPPLIFLNCAAYTNVDAAESDRETCESVNVTGAGNAALLAAEYGASAVYFSTDYVFDGRKKEPYTEADRTAALSHYGATKLRGEAAVAAACPRHYILRTAWLHGKHGTNFIRKIVRLCLTRSEIRVVDDQWGCPTFAPDLARQALALVESAAPAGLYHCVNSGRTTWYGLAETVIRRLGLPCRVVPCASMEYPQIARRPAWSVLENRRLKDLGLDRMRSWETALEDYIAQNDLVAEAKRT